MTRSNARSSRLSTLALAAGLLGGAAAAPAATTYVVEHLDSLGGASSAGIGINDRGWITGFSRKPAGGPVRAALWIGDRAPVELGTLGGPASSSAVLWPSEANNGVVVGVSETDRVDPLGEAWSCSAFIATHGNTCVGFVWRDGVMTALPTWADDSGERGNNGFAAGVNHRGEIAGWAETPVHDPSCNAPQVLQFLATVWGPGEGEMRALPPALGDSTSAATAINDRGQVAGISGSCGDAVGGPSAARALVWRGDEVADLGNLGQLAWNTPMAIGHDGTVVGFAGFKYPGDDRMHHQAFRWDGAGVMQPLGTIDEADRESQALGVNAAGQVVGLSCTPGYASCRAFLWQDGQMVALQALAPGYGGHLIYANDINDAGVVTGAAFDPVTNTVRAFRATPVDDDEVALAASHVAGPAARSVAVPDPELEQLRRNLGLAGAAQTRR